MAEALAAGVAGSSWAGPVAIAGSALAGMAGGLFSNRTNRKIAEQNIEFQREVNAQNERLMREAWARDDKARQRMVADLESAGLSKWLASGASPMSSNPVQLSAPENNYKADYSMFADSIQHLYSNMIQNEQTKRQNRILDKQAEILNEDLAIKQAEKEIKEHDRDVFKNRAGVASTDPAPMRYLSEGVNTLSGENGLVGKAVDAVAGAPRKVGEFVAEGAKGYVHNWKQAGKDIKDMSAPVVEKGKKKVKGVIDSGKEKAKQAGNYIKGKAQKVMNFLGY